MPRYRDPTKHSPRAFISYARADGEAFATSLRQRLEREEPEIILWQDRARFAGGVGWWKQITEALDEVQFLIMVMTPAVMNSAIARKEWRYGRQQGVRICPVFGVGAKDLRLESFPSWMRKAHFYDLEKEWETFVAFLKSDGETTRVPFMAPDLREDFVERPRELETLLAHLLDSSRTNPLAITTALQGAGGFGKTTLAIALCHNEDVLNVFDDGILWTTLGEHPRLQHEVTKFYAALTGERPPFVDVDDASIELAGKLDGKNCLMVIDDVWDPNDAKPFFRGGKDCARLITTRRLQVTTDIGALRVFVDEMTEGQSLRLLTNRLTQEPTDLQPFIALTRRLGEWPLLLKLAASQLRERVDRGDTMQGALAYVNRALDKRGVVAFDRSQPSERGDAVATTIAASLALLTPEDRERCLKLAIFSGERVLPISAARALWELEDFDTEDLVQRLDDAALVDFDVKTGAIRIHDVLHSHLYSQLEDPRAVHARLTSTGWGDHYALPDTYAWRFIGWHLAAAGEHARLKTLLMDPRWIHAKLVATDVQSVLQDFGLELESAELRLLRDAIRLSSHGIGRDPSQLCSQLTGRLEQGTHQAIDQLLKGLQGCAVRPWLKLEHTSLSHPGGSLITILKGHAASIEALAISADGTWAATGAADWTIRIWDLVAWRSVRILEGHTALVHSVAISANGRVIISASEDRTLRVWRFGELSQAESDGNLGASDRDDSLRRPWEGIGEEPGSVLKGHHGAVYGVAVSANGRNAVSISDDRTIRLWDLQDGTSREVFKGTSHQMRGIAFSRDGEKVFFGAGNKALQLLDLTSNSIVRTFHGHDGEVTTVAIVEEDHKVITGSDDGTLRVWDVDSGDTTLVLRGHEDSVETVAVTPDAQRAVSGSRDKTLRLWDLTTGEELQVFGGHAGSVKALATTPSGDHVVSGSGDRTLCFWNLHGPGTPPSHRVHSGPVSLLAISADGRRVVSGARGRTHALSVWHADSEASVGVLDGHTQFVSTLLMTTDGSVALTSSRDRSLRVWDLQDCTARQVLAKHSEGVSRAALTPTGSRALSLSQDKTLRAWDLASGSELAAMIGSENRSALWSLSAQEEQLEDPSKAPRVDIAQFDFRRDGLIAISPDGQRGVYTHQGLALVWNIETGAARTVALGDFEAISLIIDADSRIAVLGSRFGTLQVLDLIEAATVQKIHGPVRPVLDVAVGADRRSMIVAFRDDSIRSWDLSSGRKQQEFTVGASVVDAVVISPDGGFAFSVYGDTLVAVDLEIGRRRGSLSFDHQISALAVVPNGSRLVVGDESGRVHFLTLQRD